MIENTQKLSANQSLEKSRNNEHPINLSGEKDFIE